MFNDQEKLNGVIFVHTKRTNVEDSLEGIRFVCCPTGSAKIQRCAKLGISPDHVDNNRVKLLLQRGDKPAMVSLESQPVAVVTHVECMKLLMAMQKWSNIERSDRGDSSAITDFSFCDWLVIYCGDIGSAVLDYIYALWIHMAKQNICVPRLVVVSSREAPQAPPLPLSRCSHVCTVKKTFDSPAVVEIELKNLGGSLAEIEKLKEKYTMVIVPNQEIAEAVAKKFTDATIVSEGKATPDGDLVIIGNAHLDASNHRIRCVIDYGIESAPGGVFVRCSPETLHYRAEMANRSGAKYYRFIYSEITRTQGCEFLSSGYSANFHLSLMLNSRIDPRKVFQFSDATMQQKVKETLLQMARDGSIGLEENSVTIMPLGVRAYSMGIDLEEAKLFERWIANNEPLPIAIFIAITHQRNRVDFLTKFQSTDRHRIVRQANYSGDSYMSEMMLTVSACFVETFDIEEINEEFLEEVELEAAVCDQDAFRKILKHVQRILEVYHRESRKPIQVGTFDIADFFDELANQFEIYTHVRKVNSRDFYEGTKTYVLANDIYEPPTYLVILELAPMRSGASTNISAGTITRYFPVYNKVADN